MGYDLHIIRAGHWAESELDPIALDEWLGYVAGDLEMHLDNFAEAEVEGSTLRIRERGLAVWRAYSGHGQKGNMAWFDYRRGPRGCKKPGR
jgi:hypothetical protein